MSNENGIRTKREVCSNSMIGEEGEGREENGVGKDREMQTLTNIASSTETDVAQPSEARKECQVGQNR